MIMPTGEPMVPSEMTRAILALTSAVEKLSDRVVTKDELKLHLDGIRQQMKTADDRHDVLARQLATEQDDRKGTKKLVYAAVIASMAGVLVPLVLKGVGVA